MYKSTLEKRRSKQTMTRQEEKNDQDQAEQGHSGECRKHKITKVKQEPYISEQPVSFPSSKEQSSKHRPLKIITIRVKQEFIANDEVVEQINQQPSEPKVELPQTNQVLPEFQIRTNPGLLIPGREIGEILDHKNRNGQLKLLIKIKGYALLPCWENLEVVDQKEYESDLRSYVENLSLRRVIPLFENFPQLKRFKNKKYDEYIIKKSNNKIACGEPTKEE